MKRVGTCGVAVLIALAAGATSCSKLKSVVDPNFTAPEGTVSADARLVMWPNLPNYVLVFRDRGVLGETDPGDTLVAYAKVYDQPGSGFKGMIFDRTPASEYEIFRREPNGGVRTFQDFLANRTERWLTSHWEVFRFFDSSPSSAAPAYIGRGQVLGEVGEASPLTNTGQPHSPTVAFMDLNPSLLPGRGGFRFDWTAVPGAVGYWFQVYVFRSDVRSGIEFIQSGAPAPIYDIKSTDFYVGYMPTNTADFDTLGTDDGEQLFFQRPAVTAFLVRVTAVDAQGQLIGQTPGDAALIRSIAGEGTYGTYFVGATLISVSTDPVTGIRRIPGPGIETLRARTILHEYSDTFDPLGVPPTLLRLGVGAPQGLPIDPH